MSSTQATLSSESDLDKQVVGMSTIVELSVEEPITIRWTSYSHKASEGSSQELVGQEIGNFLEYGQSLTISDATSRMLQDDSRSHRCRLSLIKDFPRVKNPSELSTSTYEDVDATGILIRDRLSGAPSHTMWVFSQCPNIPADVLDTEIEFTLSEALKGGTAILSEYLSELANDENTKAPSSLTCNICDRNIQAWFFERHTELCLLSHQAESEVQEAQDRLQEHRAFLFKSLEAALQDGLDAEQDVSPDVVERIRHKPRQESVLAKESFVVNVESSLDYCDTALEVSAPAIPEDDGMNLLDRIQSPDSCERITQLLDWKSPGDTDAVSLELFAETRSLVSVKLDAVARLHNTIHYSERIRQELDTRVQELVDMTLHRYSDISGPESCDDTGTLSEFETPTTLELEPQASQQTLALPLIYGPQSNPIGSRNVEAINSQRTQVHSPKPSLPVPIRPEALKDLDIRAASPLSQNVTLSGDALEDCPGDPGKPDMLLEGDHKASSDHGSQSASRKNSPHDLEIQLKELRITRGIYESPRRPSGSSRPSTAYSPSRKSSRALSRSRASSLARDRAISPGHRLLSNRLSVFERDRLSPAASPTLSAADSTSTDTSHRERRASLAPPLSPRLPSIAPAARPAPPSIKDFEIIKPISKGAFGSVYLSRKRTTGDYFAIKVLKKADMIAKNQVTNIKAERAIMMAQTESPFVARLYFTFQSKEYLYLVMEYLNGGDCAALIKQLGGLPEDWTRRYMAEVVLGLEFLHGRGIIHRDLKPDNLLIDQNGHLKLTDFGLSRVGLVGRQNRARTNSHMEPVDLMGAALPGQQKTTSTSSSRSTSFDHFQSGTSTPAIASLQHNEGRGDYFNVGRRGSQQDRNPTTTHDETLIASLDNLQLDSPSSDRSRNLDESSGTIAQLANASDIMAMPPPAMKLTDLTDAPRKFVGTPDYLAPETINGSGQDDMVDWWSLGVILFEFLYGYPPFHADTPEEVFENILQRKIAWPSLAEQMEVDISPDAKDLIDKLITLDPVARLGANCGSKDVKQHKFFSQIAWDRISEEEALFIPTPDHPEDTEYFDPRGALDHVFDDETIATDTIAERHRLMLRDFNMSSNLSNVPQPAKKWMMPLSIPPHVRDRRHHARRLSESGKEDFGSFTFKNLNVLEKQNMETIRKLRSGVASAVPISIPKDAHQRSMSSSSSSNVRRSTSSASSASSIHGMSPTLINHRASLPSSPLIGKQSYATDRARASVGQAVMPADILSSSGKQNKPERTSVTSPSAKTDTENLHPVRSRALTMGATARPELPLSWLPQRRGIRVFEPDTPSSSSETESSSSIQALRRAQRRRQRSKRLSSISSRALTTHDRIHRPLNILICEDNPVSRKVLEAMLKRLQCVVTSVNDGAQAVAAATTEKIFDVIFTDIRIPRLSGIEVARLIKSSIGCNATTPIAAMSSYSTADVLDMAYFERRLEKPLTYKAVSQTLTELVPDWCPMTDDTKSEAAT